jgi:hypothetical protein
VSLVFCKTSKSPLSPIGSSKLTHSVIKYSPTLLNAMNIVGSVAGGSGNMFVFLLQRKYRFATKKGVCYGAFMTPYVVLGTVAGAADLVVTCGVPLELVPILSVSIKVSPLIRYSVFR